jgi:Cof subfamily protein (haloacid dehalogenase superfamily)
MTNIKLIVADLDNTLLRRDKTISDYTADVFRRLRGRGVLTAFATARPIRASKHAVQNDALVAHNGANVLIGNEIIHRIGIEPSDAKQIMTTLVRAFPGATLSIEIDDVLYANFDAAEEWESVSFERSDFSDLPRTPADKIIVGGLPSAELRKAAGYIPNSLYYEPSSGAHPLGLIMRREATKWNGIQILARKLGINIEEIAAFGDDWNDVEMLTHCGVGVAMANAIDACKAAADYICGDCDDDGVAQWLEENVL